MKCTCPVGQKLDAEALAAVGDALLTAKRGDPGCESLNAIVRRTGIRKESLSRHRDECLSEGPCEPPVVRDGPDRTGPRTGQNGPAKTPLGALYAVPNPLDDPPTAPRKVVNASVEQQCVALRIKGRSYASIGTELGIDPEVACDTVERVLVRTRRQTDEKVKVLRAIEAQRCDALIEAFWERATDPACATVLVPADNEAGCRPYDGQDKAADRVVKVMERRAKLLGLDAVTGPATQINLIQSPVFVEFTGIILGALSDEPAALEKVKGALRSHLEARRSGAPALPSRRA